MKDLTVFKHEKFGEVRTIDQDGEPWFVASDVASALGYAKPNNAVITHCRKVSKFSYPESGQPLNIISESDVYRLIMRSNLRDALEFQDWVVEKVLPSIRKTGSYSVQPKVMTQAEFMLAQANLMVDIERMQSEQAKQIEVVSTRLDQIETAADHFAVIGYMRYRNMPSPSLESARKHGMTLSKICKSHNIEMGTVPQGYYGRVNTYPKYILEEYFENLKGV